METDAVIRELDESIIGDINKIDDEFVIDARLVLHYDDDRLSYRTIGLPPRTKRYPPDDYDYSTYISNPDKTAFLAYVDGRVAGQLILHRHWNNFA